MTVRNPDTGEIVKLYPTEEYMGDLQAFHESACDHSGHKELRIFTARNRAKHYRYQCLTCGEAVGQSVSKGSVASEILLPFDEQLLERYRASRIKEKDEITRKHIKLQLVEGVRFSKEYKEYLVSDRWAAKRVKVMERAGNLCEGCREAKATEVHHMTYEHLFEEFLFELVALCHACHVRWHQDDEPLKDEEEELPCCACRFQAETDDGIPWCIIYEEPARIVLSSEGQCGPDHQSFEPLK